MWMSAMSAGYPESPSCPPAALAVRQFSDYGQRMEQYMVRDVRRFNRTVTTRVGALNDRFLGRGRPLGEARVLWEIGVEGCEVRSLRSRLGLDSGHASRLLRAPGAARPGGGHPPAPDRR